MASVARASKPVIGQNTNAGTSSIDVLPRDLIALILQAIPLRRRLWSASRVSKRWRAAVLESVTAIPFAVDHRALELFPSLTDVTITLSAGLIHFPSTLRSITITAPPPRSCTCTSIPSLTYLSVPIHPFIDALCPLLVASASSLSSLEIRKCYTDSSDITRLLLEGDFPSLHTLSFLYDSNELMSRFIDRYRSSLTNLKLPPTPESLPDFLPTLPSLSSLALTTNLSLHANPLTRLQNITSLKLQHLSCIGGDLLSRLLPIVIDISFPRHHFGCSIPECAEMLTRLGTRLQSLSVPANLAELLPPTLQRKIVALECDVELQRMRLQQLLPLCPNVTCIRLPIVALEVRPTFGLQFLHAIWANESTSIGDLNSACAIAPNLEKVIIWIKNSTASNVVPLLRRLLPTITRRRVPCVCVVSRNQAVRAAALSLRTEFSTLIASSDL